MKNIPSVIYYKFPIHLMKAFKYLKYQKGDLPISELLSSTIISLPMHPILIFHHRLYSKKNEICWLQEAQVLSVQTLLTN